jgi:hypothetical protein
MEAKSVARLAIKEFCGCIGANPPHIRLQPRPREVAMANKEQKRTSREAKKPKQKKKGADKKSGQPPATRV